MSPCPSVQVQLNFIYCTEMPRLLYVSIYAHSVLTSVPLGDVSFFLLVLTIIMDSQVTVVTKPTVNVRLTSTISSFEVQGRFNRGISIAELKVRLNLPNIVHFIGELCQT